MQVFRSYNAGPGSDILWQEWMLEEKKHFKKKKKVKGKIFEIKFILFKKPKRAMSDLLKTPVY